MLIAFNKPHNVLCQFTDAAHGCASAASAGRAGAAAAHGRASAASAGRAGAAAANTRADVTRASATNDQLPRRTLADFGLPPNVYAAGRLDFDSEGLLLLTDDGTLAHRLTDPRHKQVKTYWVQVEGVPNAEQLDRLRHGIELKDGPTRPAQVELIALPPLWPRNPPVRFRKTVPDAWLQLSISEGRNRQVRRMTAAVGLPTLRLVRVAIGRWELGGLASGQWRQLQSGAE